MESLPGSSIKKDSETDSQKSIEDNSQSNNSNHVKFSQTPEEKLKDDKEVTESTEDSVRELPSNNTKENKLFSDELQDTSEQEKLLEGEINTKKLETISKYSENLSKILKNQSVTIAYPFKHRSKQPFVVRPPENQAGSNRPPPRLPPPPSYYTPTRINQPPRPQESQRPHQQYQVPRPPEEPKETEGTAQSSAQGNAQAKPQENAQKSNGANVNRPATSIFVDPMPYYSTYPYFLPNILYNTVIWAQFPSKLPSNVPGCLALLSVPDCLFVIKHYVYDYFSPYDDFFLIQNKNGECLYIVQELPDFIDPYYWNSSSGYNMHFLDMYQNQVIFLNRLPGSNLCCCCYPEIIVYAPPGMIAGRITKKFNFFREEYEIWGPDGNKLFKMIGSCSICCCCSFSVDYSIRALDDNNTEVGLIRREPGFVGLEYYEVNFPSDMDVKMKAVFLGLYLY